MWTVPTEWWDELWVATRWQDFPVECIDELRDAEVMLVSELSAGPHPEAEFGFRSLALFADRQGSVRHGVTPLLLDLDLDEDEPTALNALVQRTCSLLDDWGWGYRTYCSGEGYHVEVDPRTMSGGELPPKWWLDEARTKLKTELGAAGALGGGRALIDRPHEMMRLVGSRNAKGGVKRPIVR